MEGNGGFQHSTGLSPCDVISCYGCNGHRVALVAWRCCSLAVIDRAFGREQIEERQPNAAFSRTSCPRAPPGLKGLQAITAELATYFKKAFEDATNALEQ